MRYARRGRQSAIIVWNASGTNRQRLPGVPRRRVGCTRTGLGPTCPPKRPCACPQRALQASFRGRKARRKERLPVGGSFLCWDKSCGQGAATIFADAEFAWMNRRNARSIFHFFWMGCMRSGQDNQCGAKRVHPQQKPVELMIWCMATARIGLGKTVLDPYMGTATTGVALPADGTEVRRHRD